MVNQKKVHLHPSKKKANEVHPLSSVILAKSSLKSSLGMDDRHTTRIDTTTTKSFLSSLSMTQCLSFFTGRVLIKLCSNRSTGQTAGSEIYMYSKLPLVVSDYKTWEENQEKLLLHIALTDDSDLVRKNAFISYEKKVHDLYHGRCHAISSIPQT